MELTWDLSQIYSNNNELDDDIKKLERIGEQIIKTKGCLNTKQGVINYFKTSELFSKLQDKIATYLFFNKSLDGSSVYAIEKLSELENYLYNFTSNTTFVMQELKKIPSTTLKEWSILPEFSDWDDDLLDIIKLKKHTLPETQEKIMIGASLPANQSELFDCLDNVEIKYGTTKNEQGETVKLTRANFGVLVDSNIKSVRKNASLKVLRAYKAVNQTISANYISHLKYCNFVAKTYKYKNTLDMCLQGGDLPANLPRKVVENVNKYLPLLHKYYDWRKQFMNLPKFESCDLVCNLFDKTVNPEYSLVECINIVKKALKPLGNDYINMIDVAIKDKWIDTKYMPNKDSGAYSANLYGVHPFILMTYDKTQNSVSTFAHEFGHSMHSYYSEQNQPYSKHDYEIFVAEVASTVNEILLANYFIENATSKEQKIAFITDFLGTFIGTVFTQTEYTEFELYVHDCIDKGEPLSYKKLNDFYYLLQKKYCGKSVNVIPDSKYHWSRVPHFYRSFYVFKYATGFISACAIVQKLLENDDYKNTYRKFLSAGSSKKPCDILKIAGVDILNSKTYDSAFKLFEKYLNDLTKE